MNPELNPVENLWQELKKRVHKRNPSSLDDLGTICMEEWKKIPFEVCQNLKELQKKIGGSFGCKGPCHKVLTLAYDLF